MIAGLSGAVALFGFRLGGGAVSRLALAGTGALLNSSRGDGTPFFLTARHHFLFQSTAVKLGAYESFEAFWDYTDGGDAPRAEVLERLPRSRGADLLAADEANDFALLRLREAPPGRLGRSYLGWRAAPEEERELYRVSHPYHLPQVRSTHRRLLAAETSDRFAVVGSRCCGCRPARFFHHSTCEVTLGPGSSGAPLVTPELRVAGQLWGICERGGRAFAIDGTFAHTYPLVREWLDPSGLGEAAASRR
jgi:hypothetical protein